MKVAIVGAGNMALAHTEAFNALEGVSVVGITSRTRSKAEALAADKGIEAVYDSVEELYTKTEADIVVVTVPELAAESVAKEAFKYPWAVLLEKPAGYDLQNAEAIFEASKGHKAPVCVAFNRRYYSSLIAIKADLDAHPENRRYTRVQDQQSYEEARFHNHPEEVVEKFMYANSIHLIDMIVALSRGDVTKVTPIEPWKGEETDIMLCHVEFSSGDTALYEGVWKGPGPWTCSVSTDRRAWTMAPLEDAYYQNAGERAKNLVERSQDDKDYKPGLLLQAKEMVAAAQGAENSLVTLEGSLKTMRLINQMFNV